MSSTETPSESLEEFRDRVVAFLDENATGLVLTTADERDEESVAQTRAFQKKLLDAGLAGLSYDAEFGGQGLPREYESVWREEYAKYPNMTRQLIISHGMALPMLNEYGTPEQKRRFMPRAISAEDIWCQMFSEPGAGSDVASLQMRAVKDGDQWILNGQKVWTTLAHVSQYGIVIARTDPNVPKHAGISMFIVDMSDPSIDIRAIHQIDGGMHFNEVFFSDTAIPADSLLGDLNDGWRMATAMLMYERVAIGTGQSSGISHPYADALIKAAARNGRIHDPVVRQELMKLYCQESTKSMVAMATRASLKAGKTPGPGGSLSKLHGAEIATMLRDLVPLVYGSSLQAWSSDASKGDYASTMVLSSFMNNIAGGTDQIQRNIIGDRVLGLPREPSADKGVPFSELKVGTQSL